MPNPKTLVPFKDILEAHEPDYRDTPPKGREAVITTIAVDISDEAAERGEPISDVGALRDVSALAHLPLSEVLNRTSWG